VKSALRAAIGDVIGRILVLDPAPELLLELARRRQTTAVVAVVRSAKAGRRCSAALKNLEPMTAPVAVLRHSPEAPPLASAVFEAVILADGFVPDLNPSTALRELRALLRPEGSMFVITPVREGTLGGATSATSRLLRRGGLPGRAEVTAWMLTAGMRRIRQAYVPQRLLPTTLTWAVTRPRPWENPKTLERGADVSASP
jgi:hypothetical protein